jgi:hypothetical protein
MAELASELAELIKAKNERIAELEAAIDKGIQHDCHFIVVKLEQAKQVLLQWHEKGYYPLKTSIGYTAGMPDGNLHVFFAKRTDR